MYNPGSGKPSVVLPDSEVPQAISVVIQNFKRKYIPNTLAQPNKFRKTTNFQFNSNKNVPTTTVSSSVVLDHWKIGCYRPKPIDDLCSIDEMLHKHLLDIVCVQNCGELPDNGNTEHYNWYSSCFDTENINFLIHKSCEIVVDHHQVLSPYLSQLMIHYEKYDPIKILGVYIPPHPDKKMTEVFQHLQRVIVQDVKTVPLIIMGIFNADIGSEDKKGYNADLIGSYLPTFKSNLNGTVLLNMVQLFKLKVVSSFVVGDSTFPNSQYILTNRHQLATVCKVMIVEEQLITASLISLIKRKLREMELEAVSDSEDDVLEQKLYDDISDEEPKELSEEPKKLDASFKKDEIKLIKKPEREVKQTKEVEEEQKKVVSFESKEDGLEVISDEEKFDDEKDEFEPISDDDLDLSSGDVRQNDSKLIELQPVVSKQEKLKQSDSNKQINAGPNSKTQNESKEEQKIVKKEEKKVQTEQKKPFVPEEKQQLQSKEDKKLESKLDQKAEPKQDQKAETKQDKKVQSNPIMTVEPKQDKSAQSKKEEPAKFKQLILKIQTWSMRSKTDQRKFSTLRIIEDSLQKNSADIAFILDFQADRNETEMFKIYPKINFNVFIRKKCSTVIAQNKYSTKYMSVLDCKCKNTKFKIISVQKVSERELEREFESSAQTIAFLALGNSSKFSVSEFSSKHKLKVQSDPELNFYILSKNLKSLEVGMCNIGNLFSLSSLYLTNNDNR